MIVFTGRGPPLRTQCNPMSSSRNWGAPGAPGAPLGSPKTLRCVSVGSRWPELADGFFFHCQSWMQDASRYIKMHMQKIFGGPKGRHIPGSRLRSPHSQRSKKLAVQDLDWFGHLELVEEVLYVQSFMLWAIVGLRKTMLSPRFWSQPIENTIEYLYIHIYIYR